MSMNRFNWTLYRHWILVNGLSELLGLGATAFAGWGVSRVFGSLGSGWIAVVSAGGLVALGTMLEGVLVGYAQWTVLRQVLPAMTRREWIGATTVGAAIAWCLGVIPGAAASLISTPGKSWELTNPMSHGPAVLVAATGFGLALGSVLGVPQWIVLRRHVHRAGCWVIANAVAWALGMAVIFAGVHATHDFAAPLATLGAIAGICLFTGLLVGVVHGAVLVRLVDFPKPSPALLQRSDQV